MAQTLGRGVVTVIPLTSKTDRVLPFQVLLLATQTGLAKDSKAQVEQIRSVSITRVVCPRGNGWGSASSLVR